MNECMYVCMYVRMHIHITEQSKFWMDNIKGLSSNHVFAQKSRWPYSMESIFGMNKIQGSYKVGVVIRIIPFHDIFSHHLKW